MSKFCLELMRVLTAGVLLAISGFAHAQQVYPGIAHLAFQDAWRD